MENEFLSYLTSFIALIFVICAYFTNKKNYLLFQSLCVSFLILSYLFNAQYFVMIGMALSLIRALVFYAYEKSDKNASILWSFFFSFLSLVSYVVIDLIVLKDAKPLDLLFLTALFLYAFIFRIRNIKTVRFTMLIPTALSFFFNLFAGAALFTTLSYVFEFVANCVSIVKYHVLPNRTK